MKKGFLCTFILMAYAVGTIAGVGNCIYIGEWVTALCVAVLALMAFPVARNVFNEWRKD